MQSTNIDIQVVSLRLSIALLGLLLSTGHVLGGRMTASELTLLTLLTLLLLVLAVVAAALTVILALEWARQLAHVLLWRGGGSGHGTTHGAQYGGRHVNRREVRWKHVGGMLRGRADLMLIIAGVQLGREKGTRGSEGRGLGLHGGTTRVALVTFRILVVLHGELWAHGINVGTIRLIVGVETGGEGLLIGFGGVHVGAKACIKV